jgi:two-component system, LytTR family, response regulator
MRTDVTVVIADDEPLARRALRGHLQNVPWIGAVHEVGDGVSAIGAVDTLHPDLLFLDVEMPNASGIDVAQQISFRPYIIFTTAYDRYAVTAFEIGALDYLLKPFGRARFMGVLERARVAMEHDLPPVAARAAPVLSVGTPLSRVFVKEHGRLLAIELERVERLEACDDYVALHVDGRRHLMHVRLQDLHARMDPAHFLRVHRSHVVNSAFIAALEPRQGGRVVVILMSGARVAASRTGSALLRFV